MSFWYPVQSCQQSLQHGERLLDTSESILWDRERIYVDNPCLRQVFKQFCIHISIPNISLS